MFRIDDPSAVSSLPAPEAAGTPGYFTEGNPGSAAATLVRASFLNMLQEELMSIITAGGVPPSKTTYNQVLAALNALFAKINGDATKTFSVAAATASSHAAQFGQVQSGAAIYALDTGTANTYQAAYSPAITGVPDGAVLRFKVAHANTGASTFSPNGLTAAPIWGADHQALGGGEIIANGDVWVQWNSSLNGGSGAWVLVNSTGGELPVAPATKANHALRYDQAYGVGQTLQDVKASRALSTSYTNSTGKMIFVSASVTVTTTPGIMSVAGQVGAINGLGIQTISPTGTGMELTCCFPVPAGATYQVNATNGTLSRWVECR